MKAQSQEAPEGQPVADGFLGHGIAQAVPLLEQHHLEQQHRRIGGTALVGCLENLVQYGVEPFPVQRPVDPIQHPRLVLDAPRRQLILPAFLANHRRLPGL